ncbi:MAG TPA: formate dehydrogenase subunit alpha [Candidatus Cloacimonadota bacterium]|nr:formate dehydrogenase subunit alpha [Candidatus Cloacimonadota bacterium]
MQIDINGTICDAFSDQTILQVARKNNIYIPSLCYHNKTGSGGKCRVCMVEVEGTPDLVTSCNVFCKEGMKIRTDTQMVLEAQKVVVDLILSSGKHNCLTCEKNGDCELQEAAYYLGIENPSFHIDNDSYEKDNSSEFISVNREICIACGRCVRGCNYTVVNEVIDYGQRGFQTQIIFDNNKSMGTSSCVQCGECVQLCPVGCLSDKNAKGKGRPWQLKKIESVCTYCGVGCKIHLHIDESKNKIIRITGVEESIVNKGMLCIKGRYGFDFVNSSERLKTPLIKENGTFRETSWEEAISFTVKRFKEIKNQYGADAISGLCSAKVTNEENFAFMKFMRREIGTNNIDHCARLCHSSTVAGLAATLGSGAMTNDIAGIKKADVILIIGSDTSEAHPVIAAHIKQAVRLGKTKLIVIDPKRVKMADYATIYASMKPGTDVALLNCLMQIIITNNWHDMDFINKRTEDFELFKTEVISDQYKPERVSLLSNVPEATLFEIAELFGKAETASVFYAMGITQHHTGTDNVMSLSNLQLLCGNFGKEGGGLNPLRGQSNVQGACDMGGLPDVLSGYQKINDSLVKAKFEKAWGRSLSEKPGLTLMEMIKQADNGLIKSLYIMGENPLLSDPDQNHMISVFKKLDFIVVQDIFMTETAQMAHVVFPAASFAEKTGHFTNTERRVQRLNKAIKSPGLAKPDWQIIQMLANSMGGNWTYDSEKDIWEEITELTPSYSGIKWGRDGIQWPCPSPDHMGTPVLHKDRFTRGLGLFKAIGYKSPAELTDDNYPLILTTGRILQHYHTGTLTRKTEGLNHLAKPMVMISVDDAENLSLSNSEIVKVSSRRGEIELPAFVTRRIQKGVVFIPFHYHEAPANKLTLTELDPISKIPELKVCAVKISKIK